MTVAEIKAKLPEAEVYALVPDAKYLIVVDWNAVSVSQVKSLLSAMKEHGFPPVLAIHADTSVTDPIRILEVKE